MEGAAIFPVMALQFVAAMQQSRRDRGSCRHAANVVEPQPLADAVEKVRSVPSARNNRIILADFLNRSCAFDARFESILLAAAAQNPFQQHRPESRGLFEVASSASAPREAEPNDLE